MNRHPVLVKATGHETRNTYITQQEYRFHERVRAWYSGMNGVTLDELMVALGQLDFTLNNASTLSPEERAELAADFEDVTALINRVEHLVHAWAVVTTYDPNDTFKPGHDVIWSGHLVKEDAEVVLPVWDKYLLRPNDNIRVEWRTDVRVNQLRTTGWKGPKR